MNTIPVTLDSKGLTLRGYLDLPDNSIADDSGKDSSEEKKYPIAIFLHGVCSHCGSSLHRAVSNYFTTQDYGVLRVNFSGHGNSDGEFKDVTITGQVEEAADILSFAESLPYCNGHIVLMGHSLGGLIATLVAGDYSDRIDQLILFAPAISLERSCKTGNFVNEYYDPEDYPDTIEIEGTPFSFSKEFLLSGQNINSEKKASHYENSTCMIYGTDDYFMPPKVIWDFARHFRHCGLYAVEEADHYFKGKKVEMVECIDEYLKRELRKNSQEHKE